MILRDDMLELTRRMTLSRNCFTRLAGAYLDEWGEVSDSFNVRFLNLSAAERTKNLRLAKTVPFSRTNEQLVEYSFPGKAMQKNSMWQLLNGINTCGLENDALLSIFYEEMADGYAVDHSAAIFVFHGIYDIPQKGTDREWLEGSEEVYEFIICTIGPLKGEYESDLPEFGFPFPAFTDRSADPSRIQIYHRNPDLPCEGLLYKLLGLRKNESMRT